MGTPKASLIVSTYNQQEWLEKVLWSCEVQSEPNFEIIIADDGSGKDTKEVIEKVRNGSDRRIKHVWHEDIGFRKTIILNKAIVESSSDYLIFTDGDCLLRNDFIETHLNKREKGYFLSGGYFKLPMSISKAINKQDIISGEFSTYKWLKKNGLKTSIKNLKISSTPLARRLLNAITPTGATWNGHNSSGWKEDIESVNGFDERMQYGGEDRELGERLFNKGLKSKQIRYSAICLHLDHERGYVKPEMIKNNLEIRAQTKKNRSVWAHFGIQKAKAD
jgi:glycosyltransferase involved in cell wall biosynthesis